VLREAFGSDKRGFQRIEDFVQLARRISDTADIKEGGAQTAPFQAVLAALSLGKNLALFKPREAMEVVLTQMTNVETARALSSRVGVDALLAVPSAKSPAQLTKALETLGVVIGRNLLTEQKGEAE
jgi:hypothetical protein